MATASSPQSIELSELLEVSVAAVERAMQKRKGRFPFQITVGMILDPRYPPDWAGGEIFDIGDGLTPKDHTMIIRAVMDNAIAIARTVGLQNTKFTDDEVLEAALEVNAIDAMVKSRIRLVLSTRKTMRSAEKFPSRVRDHKSSLRERIAGRSVLEKASLLRSASFDDSDLSKEARDVVAQIIEDGADTIYNPANAFYRLLQEGPRAKASDDGGVGEVADYDTVGGALGAGAGSVIPGVGTVAGGVAGAAGASAGAIIGKAILWLLE